VDPLRFHLMEITVIPLRPTPEEEPVPEDWTPTRFVGKGRRGTREVITTPQKNAELAAKIAVMLLFV